LIKEKENYEGQLRLEGRNQVTKVIWFFAGAALMRAMKIVYFENDEQEYNQRLLTGIIGVTFLALISLLRWKPNFFTIIPFFLCLVLIIAINEVSI